MGEQGSLASPTLHVEWCKLYRKLALHRCEIALHRCDIALHRREIALHRCEIARRKLDWGGA